eukprot:1112610-Amphidinium_carterae.1
MTGVRTCDRCSILLHLSPKSGSETKRPTKSDSLQTCLVHLQNYVKAWIQIRTYVTSRNALPV